MKRVNIAAHLQQGLTVHKRQNFTIHAMKGNQRTHVRSKDIRISPM